MILEELKIMFLFTPSTTITTTDDVKTTTPCVSYTQTQQTTFGQTKKLK